MPAFRVVAVQDGVDVQFEKDRALIDAFKAGFPRARWTGREWYVPGTTADKRVRNWFAEREQAAHVAKDDLKTASERLGVELRANGMPGVNGGMWGPSDPHFRMALPNVPPVAMLLEPLGIAYDAAAKAWLAPAEALPGLRVIAGQVNEAAKAAIEAARKHRDEAVAPLLAGEPRIVRDHGATLGVHTEYHPGIVALLRAVPGSEFRRNELGGGGVWHVPVTKGSLAALLAAKPEIGRLHAGVLEARAAEQRRQDEERAAKAAELAQRRFLMPVRGCPPVGSVLRLHDRIVAVDALGKRFRIDENMPNCEGSHLLGSEGELGCYVYYRPATADEITAFETRETAAAERTGARTAADRDLGDIRQAFNAAAEYPETVPGFPEGEKILVENRDLRLYGGGVEWVLSECALWQLQGNGADGDDWSRNNLASTIARRVVGPLALELAGRLRAVAMTFGQVIEPAEPSPPIRLG